MKKVVKFLLIIWHLIGDASEIEAAIINTQTLDKAISYCSKNNEFGLGYCTGVRNTIRAMLPYTKSWPQSWRCLPRQMDLEEDLKAIAAQLSRIRDGLEFINIEYEGDIPAAHLKVIAESESIRKNYGLDSSELKVAIGKANLVMGVPKGLSGEETISEIIMLAYHQIHKCK